MRGLGVDWLCHFKSQDAVLASALSSLQRSSLSINMLVFSEKSLIFFSLFHHVSSGQAPPCDSKRSKFVDTLIQYSLDVPSDPDDSTDPFHSLVPVLHANQIFNEELTLVLN